jgi:type III secretion protein C
LFGRVFSGGVIAALIFALASAGAHAEEIPFGKLQIDLQAANEPLNVFLGRMLTLAGIPSTMTPAIATGKVNGRLRGNAAQVFSDLSQTFGFTWFYNGSVLYICGLGELDSRLLQVGPSDVPRIERALNEMHLYDRRFTLKASSTEGQVLVSGPPQYVELVTDVVNRIAGSPSRKPREFDTRVFRLRYARAADTVVNIAGAETVVPGIARILNETVGGARNAPPPPSRAMPVTVPGLRGKGQTAIGRNAPSQDATAAMSAQQPQGAYIATTTPAEPLKSRGSADPMPEAVAAPSQEPETVVRADPRTNAVIVRDLPERMDMYARLIQQLDVSSPLVEIEATVVDISHDKSEQLGIDWRLHGNHADVVSSPNGLAANNSSPAPTPDLAGGLLYKLPALSAGTGLVGTVLFGTERTNFVARLNALTQSGGANLVSKPRVLTLDNTEAVLQSTQDFYVRVAGREQVDLFNVSTGLVLRVTPTLIQEANGPRIRLNIRIEDGNSATGAQVDQIPVVHRNAISTEAVIGDGQTLLIGGYSIDEKTHNDRGVPGLSNMPVLRWIFGQKSGSTRSMERMFMITPRLVQGDGAQANAGGTRTQ